MQSNQRTITSVNGISTNGLDARPRETIEPIAFDESPAAKTRKMAGEAPLLSPGLLDAIEDDLEKNEAGIPLHGANGQLVEQYRSALPILIRAYRIQFGLPLRAVAE